MSDSPPDQANADRPHFASDAYCTACGYNLRGLTSVRCPECGRPFDPSDEASFALEPPTANPLSGLLGRTARRAHRPRRATVSLEALARQLDDALLENSFLRAYLDLLAGAMVAKGVMTEAESEDLVRQAYDATMNSRPAPAVDDTQVLDILNADNEPGPQ